MCSVAQTSPTLCDPMDCSPSASSVHRILQAKILEWIAISFSRVSSWPRDWTHISGVSCIGRQILYHWATGSPKDNINCLGKLNWKGKESWMLRPTCCSLHIGSKAGIDREAIGTGRKGNLFVLTWDLDTKKYVSVMSQEFSTKNLMPYLDLRFEFMLYMSSKGIWDEIVTRKCDSRPWRHTVMNQQHCPLSHTLSGGHTGFP